MSWIVSNPNFSSGRIFYSINPLVICQNIGRLKIDAVERVQINYNFFARTINFAVENHAIRDPTAGQQKTAAGVWIDRLTAEDFVNYAHLAQFELRLAVSFTQIIYCGEHGRTLDYPRFEGPLARDVDHDQAQQNRQNALSGHARQR